MFIQNLKAFLKHKKILASLAINRKLNSLFSTQCDSVFIFSREAIKSLSHNSSACANAYEANCCLKRLNTKPVKAIDSNQKDLFHERNFRKDHQKNVIIKH